MSIDCSLLMLNIQSFNFMIPKYGKVSCFNFLCNNFIPSINIMLTNYHHIFIISILCS